MLWHVHHHFVPHIWYILGVTKKHNNVIVMLVTLWTLSAMTSKNKNGGDNSWETLYRRSMERLAFRYDRH